MDVLESTLKDLKKWRVQAACVVKMKKGTQLMCCDKLKKKCKMIERIEKSSDEDIPPLSGLPLVFSACKHLVEIQHAIAHGSSCVFEIFFILIP